MQDHRQVRPGLPARRRALDDGDVARVKGADPTTRADQAPVQILADLAEVADQLREREDLIQKRNHLIREGRDAEITYYRMAKVLSISDQAVAAVAKKQEES